MDQYVDGFLLSVPNDKLDTYRQMATKAGAIWKEHGALAYCECTGDDLDIEGMVSFKTSAAAREGEPWCSPGSSTRAGPSATASMRRSWPTRA